MIEQIIIPSMLSPVQVEGKTFIFLYENITYQILNTLERSLMKLLGITVTEYNKHQTNRLMLFRTACQSTPHLMIFKYEPVGINIRLVQGISKYTPTRPMGATNPREAVPNWWLGIIFLIVVGSVIYALFMR